MAVTQQMVATHSPVYTSIPITGTLTSPQAETGQQAGRGVVTFRNESSQDIYLTNNADVHTSLNYITIPVGDSVVYAIDTGSTVTFYFACASPTATSLKREELY